MPNILNKWDTMIIGDLSPGNAALSLLTEASIQSVIKESEEDQSKIRILLIERLLYHPKVRDKQTYIHVNQTMLIRLLDKLYAYKQISGVCNQILYLYDIIGKHLQNILDFIEDFFGNYFDRNEKVPASYRKVSTGELKKQLRRLVQIFAKDDSVDKPLINIIIPGFQQFAADGSSIISYLQLSYQKELI